MKKYLDWNELADVIGVNEYRLSLLIEDGALPRPRFIAGEKRSLFDPDEVLASKLVAKPREWLRGPSQLYGLNRVYYIAAEHFVKIGVSGNVLTRLLHIRAHNPHVPVLLYDEPGDIELERLRHAALKHAHHRAEWFHRQPVELYIEQLKNAAKENYLFEPSNLLMY